MIAESGRSAVTFESSCRSELPAAFLGFAKGSDHQRHAEHEITTLSLDENLTLTSNGLGTSQ